MENQLKTVVTQSARFKCNKKEGNRKTKNKINSDHNTYTRRKKKKKTYKTNIPNCWRLIEFHEKWVNHKKKCNQT